MPSLSVPVPAVQPLSVSVAVVMATLDDVSSGFVVLNDAVASSFTVVQVVSLYAL